MAIDKQRYNKFVKAMTDLQSQLSFKEFYKTFRVKLESVILQDYDVLRDMNKTQLKRIIGNEFNPQYAKFVTSTFSSFNNVVDMVNDYYSDLGADIQRDFSKVKAIESLTAKRLGAYNEIAVNDITTAVRKGLFNDEKWTGIARHLRRSKDNKVQFYANTIAKTSQKAYSRTVKLEKARIAEILFYEYIGIIRSNTRPFCLAMIGQTHHIDIINRLLNGQLQPVIQYCGGFRCHHDLEPDPFYNGENYNKSQVRFHELTVSGRKIRYTLKGTYLKEVEEIADKLKDDLELNSVSLFGMDKALAIESSRQILSLAKRYKTNLATIDMDEFRYIASVTGTKHMKFNKQYFTNSAAYADMVADNLAVNHFANIDTGNALRYVATHEFAHTIADVKYGTEFYQGVRDINRRYLDNLYDLNNQLSAESITRKQYNKARGKIYISGYAAKSLDEFVAEAFTNYELSSKPSPYSVEIGKLIEKHFNQPGDK